MTAGDQRGPRRCAIYTRKSSEEGLEQNFNSLDAQREACEAYIRSQVGEGWKLIRGDYGDGGYSGGSMERPGLAQLLADIRARKLDTVVVYKVDRLTRSLADFAKIVEVFDANGVSFVSVTQQFNTTTSMGRLTLNMLLSFAQFEREVTGERIRDKIAASKQKGMWMGGLVPLGYEANGRTLRIQEEEAETVRTLFRLYLEHGTVRKVKEEVDRRGWTSSVRKAGSKHGGRPFSRGHLYYLLRNPIYAGRIAHREATFDGQHPAIIDRKTWDSVQAGLAANARERSSRPRVTEPSALQGKLFDETGALLTSDHAVKSGRRYRYYVSRESADGSIRGGGQRVKRGWRLPAREIERLVSDAVTALMSDRAALTRVVREGELETGQIPRLLEASLHWKGAPLDLVQRVDLASGEMAIHFDFSALLDAKHVIVRHLVAVRLRKRGIEVRLVLDDSIPAVNKPDAALIKAVVRARVWFDDLVAGRAQSCAEIAKREGMTRRYVAHLLPLAFLAPDIVAAVLNGTQRVEITAETLTKRTHLSLHWPKQRSTLGLD